MVCLLPKQYTIFYCLHKMILICLDTKPKWNIQEMEVTFDTETRAVGGTQTRAEAGLVPRVRGWYAHCSVADIPLLRPNCILAHDQQGNATMLPPCARSLLCHMLHCTLHDLGAFDTDKTTHRAPIGLAPSRGFPTTRPTHFQTVCCLAAVVTKKPRWNNKQVDRLWNSVTV